MNSDIEESDNDTFDIDDRAIDCSPFPDECQNEIIGIESFYKCFEQRYNACPVFLMGSLRDACQAAFSSKVIKERRPVLIYIHNDKSMFNNVFCCSIFCSTTIIDYLLENYIVWPWDVTFESNRNTLRKIWQEIFSTELLDDFCVEQCPMLIGIKRLCVEEKNGLLTSEYQFKSLLKGDTLTRTEGKSSRETVLNELAIFKEECDDNEQALSSDFIANTGLCWDVIIEICKYLPLNDAIIAFSGNILPMLHKDQVKVGISDPSDSFIKMILRKINPEQIVSLQFNTNQSCSITKLTSLTMLNKVITLNLVNLPHFAEISEYTLYFSQLNCLSLWFDNEIDFIFLSSVSQYFRHPIKRFEIRCARSLCTHYFTDYFNTGFMRNDTIEYFLLDASHFPSFAITNCYQHHQTCFLMTIIGFIKSMHKIRHVRLIINKYIVEKWLDLNKWKSLASTCYQLKKVTLQILENALEDEQLSRKIMEIQNELCKEPPIIIFQVIFI